MTTIAVPDTRPRIVCPDWCTISHDEHLEDLPQLEGFVIHWSDLSQPVYLGLGAFPDGTPAPDDPPMIRLDHRLCELAVDKAEAVARRILSRVAEARS